MQCPVIPLRGGDPDYVVVVPLSMMAMSEGVGRRLPVIVIDAKLCTEKRSRKSGEERRDRRRARTKKKGAKRTSLPLLHTPEEEVLEELGFEPRIYRENFR